MLKTDLSKDPTNNNLLLHIAKTKYKSGSSLPELDLMVRSDNADARFVAEAIANDLEKNLGLKVKPKSLEWGAMLKARNRGELPSAFLSWYGDYLDPQNFLSLLLTTNASANFDKWSNPEFDKLCASADVEQNEQKRMGSSLSQLRTNVHKLQTTDRRKLS